MQESLHAVSLPDGALRHVLRPRPDGLSHRSLEDLAAEISARLELDDAELVDSGTRAEFLQTVAMRLLDATNTNANRLSARHFRDHLVHISRGARQCPWRGHPIVEMGSGSVHPWGVVFAAVLSGASQGVALDLDRPQDPGLSARLLFEQACRTSGAPGVFLPDFEDFDVRSALQGVDLEALCHGDIGGLGDKVQFLQKSATSTGLPAAHAGFVTSSSFLEHVDDARAALAEMARITKPGGYGAHCIDGADHRVYSCDVHPLQFLSEAGSERSMHYACNRIRPTSFVPLFEEAGFEVLHFDPSIKATLPDELHESFCEPWVSMPRDELEILSATVYVRRK